MHIHELKDTIFSERSLNLLQEMYGSEDVRSHAARYLQAAKGFSGHFGNREFELFTSAGRTEILGNHTDHNHGLVAAGSVHLDCIAAAAPNGTDTIRIISQTYHQDLKINLHQLQPTYRKKGSAALVRGLLAGLKKQHYKIHGLDIFTTSQVPGGSGLSSSASFEMLLCTMIDYFFNGYQQDIIAYAKSGQYAENKYWDKKSGLMDQIACAAGGIVSLDFTDPAHPEVRRIDFLPAQLGLDLVIVNTGRGHSGLSEEYSAVPEEMHTVAAFFGKQYLSQISEEEVIASAAAIREKCSDRAFLRALHFFEENKRVAELEQMMLTKDREGFLNLIRSSGNSSWKWLQNCFLASDHAHQDITVALALTELYLAKCGGACRVHGGGFAGTIAVYLPREYTNDYIGYIERLLGKGSAFLIHVRRQGACRLDFS